MPRKPFPMQRLMLASTLALVSSCAASPAHLAVVSPPAADLVVEPEPIASPDIATSEKAYEDYQDAFAAWGRRGWAAVGRLCRFAASEGAVVACPVEGKP